MRPGYDRGLQGDRGAERPCAFAPMTIVPSPARGRRHDRAPDLCGLCRRGACRNCRMLCRLGVDAARGLGAVAAARPRFACGLCLAIDTCPVRLRWRSEEHTSELQSLMRISYAVFCLKKQTPSKQATCT